MVSVIVTTYNRGKTLSRALESVLKQTHTDIEIILVDDGSTDSTEELVKAITDSRVRYIKLEKNSGASTARNCGIQEAKGDYILIWDSDDELYSNALEKIVSIFEQQPLLSIVSAPARVLIDEKEKKYPHFPTGEVMLVDILCKKLPSNMKVRVARAGVMKQVSYKSRNIDFLVNVELIERGRWYHLDEMLADVHNNQREGSLTASRKRKNMRYSIGRAPHLLSFLERQGALLKKTCVFRYADYCYGAGIGFLLAGNVQNARYLAREAVGCHPTKPSYIGLLVLSCIPGGAALFRFLY